MKHIFLLTIVFVFTTGARAQLNIVPNPSFDQTVTACPSAPAQTNRCANWWSPNSGPWVNGTPDYFNTCGSGTGNVPATAFGNCPTHSGSGMVGLIAWFNNSGFPDFREYVENALSCTMLPGVTYTLSFWVNRGSSPALAYTIDKIGLLLTAGAVNQTGPGADNYSPILATPQLETSSNVDCTNWTLFQTAYTATGAWNHLLLGCFRNNSNITVLPAAPTTTTGYAAYYFFDDIAVLTPTTPFTINTSITQANCVVTNSVSVVPTNTNYFYTYSWTPGGYTTSAMSNIPPGNYTVAVTANNGCTITTQTTQFTLNAAPGITPSITASSTLACSGFSNTLTATGATSYTWLPSNSTGSTLIVNPSGTTTYTVLAANGACTGSTTITLYDGPRIPLTTRDVTYCINSATSTVIGVSTTFTPGIPSYVWQPGGLTGQTVNVSPIINTVYTVTATYAGYCPATAFLAVTVVTNCCSHTIKDEVELTGDINGSYSNASYLITGDVTVGSAQFQDAEFRFMQGVKIIVPSGAVLDITHSHLYSCGLRMWQGIVVQDGGQVVSHNVGMGSTLIEDAAIGMDVDGITSSFVTPPLDLTEVIFNKNYTGIKISNATPGISSIPLNINSCVFTSRNLPFSSPAPFSTSSWPNADISSSGLRFDSAPTNGLVSPYDLQFYTMGNIKLPHQTQWPTFGAQQGNFGIKIENIDNQLSVLPGPGVDIGLTYQPLRDEFNLFDGLGTGIDINEGSLTTYNNVFQNMQTSLTGYGIHAVIKDGMNAKLDLSPVTGGYASKHFGNSFWNCPIAIMATDVYDVNIEYNLFRSTHNSSAPGFGPGADGVLLYSNRFKYNIQECEFNNIAYNLWIVANTGQFDVNGVSGSNGTYADNISIMRNYFGPQVASSIPLFGEYSNKAINLLGNTAGNWQMAGIANVYSNKLDRVYRGIRVEKMDEYPIEIAANDIQLEDDVMAGGAQYGIYASESLGNLIINQNNVRGTGTANQNVKLIHCANNLAGANMLSPIVTLNEVFNGYQGFVFEGNQPNTSWLCNRMVLPMRYGLSLEQNGIIGIQGSTCQESGNDWVLGPIAPVFWTAGSDDYTYCDGTSDASNSRIYANTPSAFTPGHAAAGGGTAYVNGSNTTSDSFTIFYNCNAGNDCPASSTYPNVPSQRSAQQTETAITKEINTNTLIQMFPNPADESFTISTGGPDIISLTIADITGKTIYVGKNISKTDCIVNISQFKPALYFVVINTNDNKTTRLKLVKTN